MLQVARLAPRQLGEATARVAAFLHDEFHEDGGARDRAGESDLYYTVFALDGLLALQAELPIEKTSRYLEGFGDGDGLDLVHLACLARSWAALPEAPSDSIRAGIANHLARFRAADGGFAANPSELKGTVYHSFLAVGAHQDLGTELDELDRLLASVESLKTKDGAYANLPDLPLGSTTVTAAAVTLLRYFGHKPGPALADWLLARAHAEGGFVTSPDTPLPDLLSTATALHALSGLHADYSAVREACLDFVDTLWTGKAFCSHWADDAQDCEYTFYALLALGHLSV